MVVDGEVGEAFSDGCFGVVAVEVVAGIGRYFGVRRPVEVKSVEGESLRFSGVGDEVRFAANLRFACAGANVSDGDSADFVFTLGHPVDVAGVDRDATYIYVDGSQVVEVVLRPIQYYFYYE